METRTITKPLKVLVENLAVQNGIGFDAYTYDIEIRGAFLIVEYHEQPSKKGRKLRYWNYSLAPSP